KGGTLGSYGVHYGPNGPYGASRDHHTLATDVQRERYEHWLTLDEDDRYDDENYLPYAGCFNHCCYHDDKLCLCAGAILVEIITDDDERAFLIAAMMADIPSREYPWTPITGYDVNDPDRNNPF